MRRLSSKSTFSGAAVTKPKLPKVELKYPETIMSALSIKQEAPQMEDIEVQIITQGPHEHPYFSSESMVDVAGEETIETEEIIDCNNDEIKYGEVEYMAVVVNEQGEQILVHTDAQHDTQSLSPTALVKPEDEETPEASHEVQVATILLDAAGGRLNENEVQIVNDPEEMNPHEVVIESSTSVKSNEAEYQEAFLNFCEGVQKEMDYSADDPDRRFKCSQCPKAYMDPSSLSKHRKIHNMGRPFVCNVCGNAFNHPSNLTKHMKIHLKDKPYKCTTCQKLFADLSNLNKHEKLHTNIKPYICSICDRSFADPSNMRKHFKLHFGDRPFKCEICDKSFADSSNLKKHKVIHLDHRPHMCAICQKTFTDTSNLNKHIRLHNGEKPYKCVMCEKAFADLSNLRKHERTHSDVKPFICGICDKKYSDKSNLTKHMKSHSDPTKSFMCAVCGRVFASMKGVQMHCRAHADAEPVVARTVVIRSSEGEEGVTQGDQNSSFAPIVIIQGMPGTEEATGEKDTHIFIDGNKVVSKEEFEGAADRVYKKETTDVVHREEIEGATDVVYREEIEEGGTDIVYRGEIEGATEVVYSEGFEGTTEVVCTEETVSGTEVSLPEDNDQLSHYVTEGPNNDTQETILIINQQ